MRKRKLPEEEIRLEWLKKRKWENEKMKK
jgi:hypothetical protein